MTAQTVDPAEIEHFSKMAEDWWNPNGKFAPLHRIAPHRLHYVKQQICQHYQRDTSSPSALTGLTLLDVGCGGGLIAEPMTRLGATVTGIDATEKNIKTASLHARQQQLEITYRHTTTDQLVAEKAQFDVVLALEVLEHVADVPQFLQEVATLCKPGGIVLFSTLNRTPQSYLKAIIGAEYLLRWLPRGTHHWQKFITPAELTIAAEACGLTVTDITGLSMNPISFRWNLSADVSVNYFVRCIR